MSAPPDAGMPESAPADAGVPEPAPADAGPAEPAAADAGVPEPAPGEGGSQEPVSVGASRAGPAPADGALAESAPASGGPPEPVPAGVGRAEPGPAGGAPPQAPHGIPQNLRGHYAGFASRFIAFVFDCVVSVGVFMLILAAASFAASVLTGTSIHWNRGNTWVVVAFFAWELFYYAYFWTASGKTPGMVLLGVQVVGQDGSHVGTHRGLVRTLAFPLSFILLGLGFLGILFGRDRRALHDVIAGTAVVYCWDAREARLRSLARQGGGRRP